MQDLDLIRDHFNDVVFFVALKLFIFYALVIILKRSIKMINTVGSLFTGGFNQINIPDIYKFEIQKSNEELEKVAKELSSNEKRKPLLVKNMMRHLPAEVIKKIFLDFLPVEDVFACSHGSQSFYKIFHVYVIISAMTPNRLDLFFKVDQEKNLDALSRSKNFIARSYFRLKCQNEYTQIVCANMTRYTELSMEAMKKSFSENLEIGGNN